MSKFTEKIAKEKKEVQTKELNRLKYRCENCNKLFSDVQVLHTGSGCMCPKCGEMTIEKKVNNGALDIIT